MTPQVHQLEPVRLGDPHAEDVSVRCELPWAPSPDERFLRNVTVPTLTPFLPDPGARTGTGVVIAPGGGLHFLSVDNEGAWVARRLAEQGIAAFVLHYRTAPTPASPAEFGTVLERIFTDRAYVAQVAGPHRALARADGGAAVRLVRDRADEWGVDPDRVGMLGFSAGGFVALATTVDGGPAERPSFIAPVYPAWWSDDLPVPEPTPPLFLAWASDDQLGDGIIGPSLRVYQAWRAAGAAAEAHAYARGGHGFGIRPQGAPSDAWFDDFLAWLAAAGLR